MPRSLAFADPRCPTSDEPSKSLIPKGYKETVTRDSLLSAERAALGWQRTVVHPWQMTTVWAWEKTVVMVKQPGHLTSMKKERGAGTRVCPACEHEKFETEGEGQGEAIVALSYLELVLAGLGGRGGVEEINGENLGEKPSA
ncbi:hypothetical protein ColLi_07468 [Colletotrichum liriopes]|uniref:Uncharacterized protein n=1 Tax=Colletotrichum liriopes TaxID=708192 RepID=A0AA37GPW0_9PEZI|nr:hypothetical protein ColLi_07468 [Colletotrichum liriopes]